MGGTRGKIIETRTYKNYSKNTMDKALKEIALKNMNLPKASKVFNIPLGTLSHKFRKKHGKRPGRPTAFSITKEAVFCKHIETVGNWGYPSTSLSLEC